MAVIIEQYLTWKEVQTALAEYALKKVDQDPAILDRAGVKFSITTYSENVSSHVLVPVDIHHAELRLDMPDTGRRS